MVEIDERYFAFPKSAGSLKFIVMGRGTERSSNQAPNNATQTKQNAHKQE